ncbi:MAG TPA: type IV secretion system DNA-binding domain-containing protein [Candidatus Faecousia intestinigallinarum]|nr:type IV secretion system DNA-binding domain-containing protein [Candidatus Faecousia intestinigallinarum]
MQCAWDAFLGLLPLWMRREVDERGRTSLQELRLRSKQPPELVLGKESFWLSRPASPEDLAFVVNSASRYSPWTAATSAQGYITGPGGHRVGLCGEAVLTDGVLAGLRSYHSLCLRVARDFPGIAGQAGKETGSILILGSPGSGKTTLLRDLIRQRSGRCPGSVAVVDERGELFPQSGQEPCFSQGPRTDILTGCPKSQGVEMVLRTMGPSCIAVDEITAEEDCHALTQAGWCGVKLLATAHATSKEDLFSRNVYKPLVEKDLFDLLLVMSPDKTWRMERMRTWN